MKRMTWILAASAALVAMSACGGSNTGGGGSSFEAQIQGTWLALCNTVSGSTERLSFTFSGLGFTRTFKTYTNVTCTEPGTVVSTETGSIVIGSAVTANLGSTPVTAYKIDATLSASPGQTAYDLGYVDTTVTPNRLYVGDSTGVNTGNTAATRPTTLDGTSYLVKQ